MRATVLSIILMIIAAVMMGCTGDIIPCTDDAECAIDTGGFGPDIPMVCDTTVTPQEKCDDMYGWMDGGLPFPIDIPFPFPIPDCTDSTLYPDTGGVCEISFDFPDFPF